MASYFETLNRSLLYFAVQRDKADGRFGWDRALFEHDPRVAGGMVWAVYTEGMLPAPDPHRVFGWKKFSWLMEDWKPDYPTMIVVNPGSPCEAFLPTTPQHSHAWTQYAKRKGGPSDQPTLRTLRVCGPLHGPVAHGLACGAHIIVHHGRPWNSLAYHGHGYRSERRILRKSWGITSHQEWQAQLHALQAADDGTSVLEFTLGLRRTIARDFGGQVETGYWLDAAARVLRARAEGGTVLTLDGVTKTAPVPEAETEARVNHVQHLIGRITRYQARMRADGILSEGQYVTSADAWDLGRASCMARWGLSTRHGTLPEAEAAVIEAGRNAARCYESWQDFSAGFILGRCLHFDKGGGTRQRPHVPARSAALGRAAPVLGDH